MWTRVFENSDDIEAATTCNFPGEPDKAPTNGASPRAGLGQMLGRNALDRTTPVPPSDVRVRVLNGNGENRQATLITDELDNLGFTKGGDPTNDPVYTEYDMRCHGQIRFGAAGAGGARTLSLLNPCLQLVRDEREDASVDMALGGDFDDIKSTPEAKQILQQLKNWVPERDQQDAAHREITPPSISEELLIAARDVHC